jgi:hypothetical protein
MKPIKYILVSALVILLVTLQACEVEYRDGHRYPHAMGWEHQHHPDHKEYYNHGFHHDKNGNEIVGHPQMGGVEPGH